MVPTIGSEWIAGDGRKMRVEEIIIPRDPADMPWAKLTVLNPGKGMRRKTEMSTRAFGTNISPGFLRPLEESTCAK